MVEPNNIPGQQPAHITVVPGLGNILMDVAFVDGLHQIFHIRVGRQQEPGRVWNIKMFLTVRDNCRPWFRSSKAIGGIFVESRPFRKSPDIHVKASIYPYPYGCPGSRKA